VRHHLSEFNILHPNANSRMISLKFQLCGSMCGYVAFSKLPRALYRFMSLPVCGQSFVLLPPGKSPQHASVITPLCSGKLTSILICWRKLGVT